MIIGLSVTVNGRDAKPRVPVAEEVGSQQSEVTWSGPGRFGAKAAFAAKTGTAAPLLAGFSLTLLGVVGQAPSSFRWPGAAMLVLVLVVTLMVGCVQFGFRGLDVFYSRDDIEQWIPLTNEDHRIQLNRLSVMQREDMAVWRRWHKWSRNFYNSGIVLLGVGMALVLAPPLNYQAGNPLSHDEAWIRWAGTCVATLATAAEIVWIITDGHLARRAVRGR